MSVVACLYSTLAATPTSIETINFGDSAESISLKLQSSTSFQSNLSEGSIEQQDLNGAFRSNVDILGVPYYLCFQFHANRLSDLHFRSEIQHSHQYSSTIKELWEESVTLVTNIYGASKHQLPMPASSSIFKNTIMYSHIWKNGNTTILAGIGEEQGAYYSIITFTQTNITDLPERSN